MSSPPAPRPGPGARADVGELPTGPHNAITDVPGVRVGHVTCWSDDPVARTGVTAILPTSLEDLFQRPPAAGVAVLNGCGELTGSISITELGFLDTPIMLTGTPSVGRVYDAVVDAMFDAVPAVGDDDVVVARRRRVQRRLARRHPAAQRDGRRRPGGDRRGDAGPVSEGVVGAGTGMITMEYKGGIGTSLARARRARHDRRARCSPTSAVAAAPRGRRPVGRDARRRGRRRPARWSTAAAASASSLTDIPLDARQLTRVARRVGLGLARVGSVAGHGSGDIFCAVSTEHRLPASRPAWPPRRCSSTTSSDDVFAATVDATEESVANALFVADTVTGRGGNTAPGLPVERVLQLL